MRSILFHLLLLGLLGHDARAQTPQPAPPVAYQAVDANMQQVPDSSTRTARALARYIAASFSTEADRARAAFVWVARNIRYDVDNRFLLEFEREPAVVVQETLDQRRGVCRHYAKLYAALANQAGVLTYVVPGYSSRRDSTSHAWCASRIDGQWQLLDPTWAAGQVVKGRFEFRFSNEHFRVAPEVFIETHMPFDPMWQLLPAPRTPQQFQQGLPPATPQFAFAFADSVAAYGRQTPLQQLRATNRRIEQNGGKNGLILMHLANNRTREDNLHATAFNEGLSSYNQGIEQLNGFIEYLNRRLQPRRSDAELRLLLPPIATRFADFRALVATVHTDDPARRAALHQFEASLREAEAKLSTCQVFMERYLNSGRLTRPATFLNFSNLSGRNEMAR